jgi:hypothetical protein
MVELTMLRMLAVNSIAATLVFMVLSGHEGAFHT